MLETARIIAAMAKKKIAGARDFGKALTDDPDDALELLNDFFRHGELRHGDRLVRRGPPPVAPPRSTKRACRRSRQGPSDESVGRVF